MHLNVVVLPAPFNPSNPNHLLFPRNNNFNIRIQKRKKIIPCSAQVEIRNKIKKIKNGGRPKKNEKKIMIHINIYQMYYLKYLIIKKVKNISIVK